MTQLLTMSLWLLAAIPALAEPDWKWVQASNLIDKWSVEQGLAEVRIKNDGFEARLYKPTDLKTVYMRLNGTIDKSRIVANQTMADNSKSPSKFRGPMKSSHWKAFENHSGVETITLTDGWSMIGLTRGISKKQ